MRSLTLSILASSLLLAGCQTPNAPPKTLATTVVDAAELSTVRLATVSVFERAGYESRILYGPEWVFEKRGSVTDDLLRGGSLSLKTVQRVRVRVLPEGPRRHRLEATAFTVQYPGDRVMEEQFPIHRRGPYRKLLDQIPAEVSRE